MFRRRPVLDRLLAVPCDPHQRPTEFLCKNTRGTGFTPKYTDVQELGTRCVVVCVEPDRKDDVGYARPIQ